MKRRLVLPLILSVLGLSTLWANQRDGHPIREKKPEGTLDTALLEDLYQQKTLFPKGTPNKQSRPVVNDEDFITLAYLQDPDTLPHIRWHAITHMTSTFIRFDSNGNLTNRFSQWDNRSFHLKAGGSAEAAGTKVLFILNSFDDDPGGAIEQVMTNASKRQNLAENVADALQFDTGAYNHGVNLDIEFSWGPDVRDGLVLFIKALREELDSRNMQDKEISIYTTPGLNTDQWDIAGMEPYLDYLVYSGYDWGTGSAPNAVSDHERMTTSDYRLPGNLELGLPPEKLVIAYSTYGRTWQNTTQYGVSGGSSSSTGRGFTDGLYMTTLTTLYGGPYQHNYQKGDEAAWFTFNDGTPQVVTWEGLEGIAYKYRQTLALEDSTGGENFDGIKLRGISFWSCMWLTEQTSWNPRAGSTQSITRTYPHVFQELQEVLARPGDNEFLITGFDSLDPRWTDPNNSPDTKGDTNFDSARSIVVSPGDEGGPEYSTNALLLKVDTESAGSNRVIIAHEILANSSFSLRSIPDVNAAAAVFDISTELGAYIYMETEETDASVRLMIIDADHEIEVSPAFPLNQTGWQRVKWDLTDTSSVSPYTTQEPILNSGDGVIDTDGNGKEDLGFYGFVVEVEGSKSFDVLLDHVTYTHAMPDGLHYTINEFRYDQNDQEFLEIHGPAGPLPQGFAVRVMNGGNGNISTHSVSGTISDSGDGTGLFVIGDPSTPNLDNQAFFSAGDDDLLNGAPSAIQLFNTLVHAPYDSVVYEAWGGLDELVRLETMGVTDEGYPWLGRISSGTDNGGDLYTKGRYPDGNDTDINGNDFSVMKATPGEPNGKNIIESTSLNFDSIPNFAYQTFQSPTTGTSGVGPSPSGGDVFRCVDTSGGGVISYFGDSSLGTTPPFDTGYTVRGELFIPPPEHPEQAVAVGICGRQGGVFFSDFSGSNGYEQGYWLIYENRSDVNLANGRPDHPQTFEFVHATHDNQDLNPVNLLASFSAAQSDVTPGTWAEFSLTVAPENPSDFQLFVELNSELVYNGPIPDGGPVSGAFQVGFRENHPGNPNLQEGTWVDNIRITPPLSPPADSDLFFMY